MASSFSTDLKLELMVTGENAGTWGDKTNSNLNLVQQAIAGFESISIAGGAQTTNLLMSNAALSQARNAVIKLTGVITGNQIVTVPTGIEKTYIVQNGTTGAFTVQFIQAGGTGTTFSTTDKGIKILFADGTNINPVDLDTLSGTIATAQIEDLAVTSGKLASFAVTSARLASFAVTTSRLATNAVTAIKITQSTITQSKLATDSVGSAQLIATAVTAGSYTSATITVDADGRITAASSGTGGFTQPRITRNTGGPSASTHTALTTATVLSVFVSAGGGTGSGSPDGYPGSAAGNGAMVYARIPKSPGPLAAIPFSVGGASGATNFGGPTGFTLNAGNNGQRNPNFTNTNGNPGTVSTGGAYTATITYAPGPLSNRGNPGDQSIRGTINQPLRALFYGNPEADFTQTQQNDLGYPFETACFPMSSGAAAFGSGGNGQGSSAVPGLPGRLLIIEI